MRSKLKPDERYFPIVHENYVRRIVKVRITGISNLSSDKHGVYFEVDDVRTGATYVVQDSWLFTSYSMAKLAGLRDMIRWATDDVRRLRKEWHKYMKYGSYEAAQLCQIRRVVAKRALEKVGRR